MKPQPNKMPLASKGLVRGSNENGNTSMYTTAMRTPRVTVRPIYIGRPCKNYLISRTRLYNALLSALLAATVDQLIRHL